MRKLIGLLTLIALPLFGQSYVQGSFPQSTVTVYDAGTVNLSTIYSDSALTVAKSNPFTAATNGHWFFNAADGCYDVRFSGGGIPANYTTGDVCIRAATGVKRAQGFVTYGGMKLTRMSSFFGTPVSTSRSINTTFPLTGGGDLSGDLTLACPTCLTSGGAVTSFNTRTGAVSPLQADYDAFFLTELEGDARYYRFGGTDVAIADGGTGQSTKAAAFDALTPLTGLRGSLITHGGGLGLETLVIQAGPAGSALVMANDGTLPEWSVWPPYMPAGTDVAISDGGTGQSTKTAAFDALAPTTTQGDIIYYNGTDNVRLAKGAAATILTMNAGATAPEWATSAYVPLARTISPGTGLTGGGDLSADRTLSLLYTNNLASNPALAISECTFTNQNSGATETGAGGIICEGTTADTNEVALVFDSLVTATGDARTIIPRPVSGDYKLAALEKAQTWTATQSFNVDIAIADGGTGQSTAALGFDALSPLAVTGDMILFIGGSGNIRLPMGTANQVLAVDPTGSLPVWTTPNSPLTTPRSVVTLVNGANENIDIGNASYVKIVGPTGAFSIGGFTGGSNGRHLWVWQSVAQTCTVTFNSAGSSAGNKIQTMTSANHVMTATRMGSLHFIYDSGSAVWVLMSEDSY